MNAAGDVQAQLGIQLCCNREWARALDLLDPLLQAEPQRYVARLFLGLAQRQVGEADHGARNCLRALQDARRLGYWRDNSTTPAWLRHYVKAGVAVVADFQRTRLHAAIARAREEQQLPDTGRIDRFVDGYVEGLLINPDDPRQQPKKHLIPGVPASPWIDTALLPWVSVLESNWDTIRNEFLAIHAGASGVESFLKFTSPSQIPRYLTGNGVSPSWDAYFFYRHGVRNEENCARCPQTAALLETLPLFRVPGFAPEICFSILSPGTRILPHRGDSNARVVVHLPLVVPEGCALKVAGEARAWHEGRVMVFDDTYEHEAWNNSGHFRAILLLDAWNPHLTESEQRAFVAVTSEIHRLGQLLAMGADSSA
ncbi:aspartyl/asparaginyl beta-hydroxylase domain-containing protein [Fontimonas sp. SYSU GA230001]|uniref:aspartyl/asparaginyl beta-hydroxylase domain-containing protein n=1 Tax=Fontimonas sp. SYSU GA230001 TaxID=3142450 RepID=UPI0032B33BD5